MLFAPDPILPAWFVLPLAVLTMIVVGFHIQWMHRVSMPGSRRRIRTASNMVSLLAIPLFATGFGLISPGDHRLFVGVWFLAMSLLGIIILLAGIDMLNSFRLHAAERRHLRSQIRRLESEFKTLMAERQHSS